MANIRVEQRLETLGGQHIFHVILPEQGALCDAPVVWLLHGAGDNGTGWLRYTAVERYAFAHNIAVILPDVGNSYYTSMDSGVDAFACLTQELPAVCRRLFGLSPAREKNYLLGNSMGGYGALLAALSCPQQYAACAALSGAFRPQRIVHDADWPLPSASARAIFGPGIEQGLLPERMDIHRLIAAADPAALPALTLICGAQDALHADSCALSAELSARGIAHTFQTVPGGHTWELWDAQSRRVLDTWFGA